MATATEGPSSEASLAGGAERCPRLAVTWAYIGRPLCKSRSVSVGRAVTCVEAFAGEALVLLGQARLGLFALDDALGGLVELSDILITRDAGRVFLTVDDRLELLLD